MKLHLPKTLRTALATVAAAVFPVATTVAAGVLTFGSSAFAEGDESTYDTTFTAIVPNASDARLGAGKTVCFNIPAGGDSYLSEDGEIACDIVVKNAYFTNSYSDRIYNFTGTISGDGTWNYNPSGNGNRMTYQFYGDMADYSGNMSVVDGKTARFYYFGNQVGKDGAAGTITAKNAASSVNIYGATLYSTAIQTSNLVVGITENTTSTNNSYVDDYKPATTYGASTVYGAITATKLTIETGATLNVSATGSDTIASTVTTLANNGVLNINEGTSLTVSNLTMGDGSSITNTGTLTVTGTITGTFDWLMSGDSSITYSDGDNGYRSGTATKKLFDGSTTVTASQITIAETAYDLDKTDTGVFVTYTSDSSDRHYYVNSEVVYGDDGNSAAADETSGIVISGGNLVLNSSFTKEGAGFITSEKAGTITLNGDGTVLKASSVSASEAVTLAGDGEFVVDGSIANIAAGSNWTGTATVKDQSYNSETNYFGVIQTVANENSTLKLNNVSTSWFRSTADNWNVTVDSKVYMDGTDSLTVTNGGGGGAYLFTNTVEGEGNLVVKPTSAGDSFTGNTFTFSGDVSKWTGTFKVVSRSWNAVFDGTSDVGTKFAVNANQTLNVTIGGGTKEVTGTFSATGALNLTTEGEDTTKTFTQAVNVNNMTLGSAAIFKDTVTINGTATAAGDITLTKDKAFTIKKNARLTTSDGVVYAGNGTSNGTITRTGDGAKVFNVSGDNGNNSANKGEEFTVSGLNMTVTGGSKDVKVINSKLENVAFVNNSGKTNITVRGSTLSSLTLNGDTDMVLWAESTVGGLTMADNTKLQLGRTVTLTGDISMGAGASIITRKQGGENWTDSLSPQQLKVTGTSAVTTDAKITAPINVTSTGTLTVNEGKTLTATSITVDGTMNVNGTLALSAVKTISGTGTLAFGENAALDLTGLTVDAAGSYVLATAGTVTATNIAVNNLTIDSTKFNWALNTNSDNLTLTVTAVTTPTVAPYVSAVAWDDVNNALQVAIAGDIPSTGALAVVVSGEMWDKMMQTVTANGGSVSGEGVAFSLVDSTNAALNLAGITSVTFNGYAGESNGQYAVIFIPEPATATLGLLALAGLAVRRRRKH